MKRGVQHVGVVAHHFFEAETEAGQHPRQIDVLLVEFANSFGAIAGRRRNGSHLDDVAHLETVVILRAEIHLERTGLTDRIVGGVRDEGEQLVVHEKRLATVDLDPVDRVTVLAWQMTSDRVVSLVVVLVGVAQPVGDVGWHRSFQCCR